MTSIRQWLGDLGLDQYADAFEANDIDMELLAQVDDQVLKDIGVASAGHRLRIRTAARKAPVPAASDEAGHAPGAGEPARDAAAAPAERRQLTVMFCDLVGSTELSHRLDPEALRELMRAYQRSCSAVVERYAGHIAQYLGDGLMVYFGWPRAHEDDAERAVRAGLEIVDAVKKVAAPAPLRVRIGIATGPVVVGETGAGDASIPKVAVGETPNLAARLQGLAQADQVVIGSGTHRLLGGAFDYIDLGEHALKGIVEPIRALRVTGLRQAEGRFEARQEGELTPFVGRDEEIALLLRRWEKARTGEGQVVLLSGEPGLGKSRIMREVRGRIGSAPHTRLRYQCSPFHTQSALYPVIEQFERAAGFSKEDTPDIRLAKTEALIGQALEPRRAAAVLPLFAAMLSLPLDRFPPSAYAPQKQKELTLEALVEQVVALSAPQPVLMMFEDAHWVDPTTQEVLDLLVARVAQLPVLLLITYRPEYAVHWSSEPHVTAVTLSRLDRRLGAELAERVVGGQALPVQVLDQILVKTDGVPLFVEELTKAVVESGLVRLGQNGYELTGPLSELAIPSTLHDSLMARLDRLSEVREVAQIGACIGREFSHDLLALVSPVPGSKLQAALQQLADAELIFRRGTPPDAVYTFKHALVRDAAYASLLKSRRQVLHRTIGEALEARFGGQVATAPELAAHHYTEAGVQDKAVAFWLEAGRRAIARFANAEAIGHATAGLRLIQSLPEGMERDRTELLLQSTLGTALASSQGYTPPEVGKVFARARELSERVGDTPEKFLILFGLWVYYLMGADYDTARELGAQIFAQANEADEPGAVVLGHHCVGCTAMFVGDVVQALPTLKTGCELYRAAGPQPLGAVYGLDPGILCFEWVAWSSLAMGYLDQAQRAYATGIDYAHRHGHVLTVGTTRTHYAVFLAMCEDLPATLEHAASAVAFCKENSILFRQAEAQIVEGWAVAQSGDPEGGVAEVEAGLAIWRQLGTLIFDSFWYLLLAKAYLCAGRLSDARTALQTAFQAANEHGEHLSTAELHRFDGELWLASREHDKAEQCFRAAIERARPQQAKLWELRASVALARLWMQQGKRKEARNVLAPVYDWFTEGFGTRDVLDAKALLEELAASLRSAGSHTL